MEYLINEIHTSVWVKSLCDAIPLRVMKSAHMADCGIFYNGGIMKENLLVELSKQFAIIIVNVCVEAIDNRKSKVLFNQLLRSGTSIGANIHEANYASSRPDFINKMQIALKECYETEYWLDLFKETNLIEELTYQDLYATCSKIRKVLIASITTAKSAE